LITDVPGESFEMIIVGASYALLRISKTVRTKEIRQGTPLGVKAYGGILKSDDGWLNLKWLVDACAIADIESLMRLV
jgi:hypothetical protein